MATEFLPFATGGSANVESQAAYAADAARTNGFSTGVASSAKFNKAIRQGAFGVAGFTTWLSNILGVDIADDGDLSGFVTKITNAIAPKVSPALTGTPTAPTATTGTNTTQLATTAFARDADLGGPSQAWTDVTSSRAVGTSYTNSTNRPIMVMVSIGTSNTTDTPVYIMIGGSYFRASTCNSGKSESACNFIVPAGLTYGISASNSSMTAGALSLGFVGGTGWSELR